MPSGGSRGAAAASSAGTPLAVNQVVQRPVAGGAGECADAGERQLLDRLARAGSRRPAPARPRPDGARRPNRAIARAVRTARGRAERRASQTGPDAGQVRRLVGGQRARQQGQFVQQLPRRARRRSAGGRGRRRRPRAPGPGRRPRRSQRGGRRPSASRPSSRPGAARGPTRSSGWTQVRRSGHRPRRPPARRTPPRGRAVAPCPGRRPRGSPRRGSRAGACRSRRLASGDRLRPVRGTAASPCSAPAIAPLIVAMESQSRP